MQCGKYTSTFLGALCKPKDQLILSYRCSNAYSSIMSSHHSAKPGSDLQNLGVVRNALAGLYDRQDKDFIESFNSYLDPLRSDLVHF